MGNCYERTHANKVSGHKRSSEEEPEKQKSPRCLYKKDKGGASCKKRYLVVLFPSQWQRELFRDETGVKTGKGSKREKKTPLSVAALSSPLRLNISLTACSTVTISRDPKRGMKATSNTIRNYYHTLQ